MPPSRLLLPRTLRLPQTSSIDGSILPCASATISASLARSPLFLLRGLVKAAFGHIAPISRPWPPEFVVMRPSPVPHSPLLEQKLQRLRTTNLFTQKGSSSSALSKSDLAAMTKL